ncbi:hypothetical protein AF72_02890 [Xylella taiwanensis]|uniref:Uncharacterized protein n=1 Tax=Xylella taiwanensis TaxID=1444770 RepID=Z9JMB0_9GAMM|nr:hypothetical protein AB672_09925 [Xylella taiwanensis]EWS78912.1 hypothetical protein AF72_02890 [Xylella taiwanensis]
MMLFIFRNRSDEKHQRQEERSNNEFKEKTFTVGLVHIPKITSQAMMTPYMPRFTLQSEYICTLFVIHTFNTHLRLF